MTLPDRLQAFIRLGDHLSGPEDEFLTALQKRTEFNNGWLTLDAQRAAIDAIRTAFLAADKLTQWAARYPIEEAEARRGELQTVGLVLAGNIPLVGFHDVLCAFVAGYRSRIKLSSKDPYVLPYLLQLLAKYDARAAGYFEIVDKLSDYDRVIATGSNNSARYFEAYFGGVPHVIRRNRNAVAVLTGEETPEDLTALGEDVFRYFGLGCRNVSKLYVPRGYDFQPLLEAFHAWKHLQNHGKWKNNFDYNYAIATLNKESFHLTGPLMLFEAEPIVSRIATLHFSYYDSMENLVGELNERAEEIQLVVTSNANAFGEPAGASVDVSRLKREATVAIERPCFHFGEAQSPGLADYADGVDTMEFLAG